MNFLKVGSTVKSRRSGGSVVLQLTLLLDHSELEISEPAFSGYLQIPLWEQACCTIES